MIDFPLTEGSLSRCHMNGRNVIYWIADTRSNQGIQMPNFQFGGSNLVSNERLCGAVLRSSDSKVRSHSKKEAFDLKFKKINILEMNKLINLKADDDNFIKKLDSFSSLNDSRRSSHKSTCETMVWSPHAERQSDGRMIYAFSLLCWMCDAQTSGKNKTPLWSPSWSPY